MKKQIIILDVRWAVDMFAHIPEGITILNIIFDLVPLNYHYLINSGDYSEDLNNFMKQMDYITSGNLSDDLYETIISALGDMDDQQTLRSDSLFHSEYDRIIKCLQQVTWEFIQAMRRVLPLGDHFKVRDICSCEFVRHDLKYELTIESDHE